MEMEDGSLMKSNQKEHERIKGHPITRPNMRLTTLCPKCRYAVSDLWNYCPHCGLKLAPVNKEGETKDVIN